MPSALSNAAWAKICAAAERRPKAEAESRAMLSAVLFDEYPVFRYDREHVVGDRERGKQMLEHLDAFAELYRQRWLPSLTDDEFEAIILTLKASPFVADDVRTEAHLWWLSRLRLHALALRDHAHRKQLSNTKNADSQRDWLVHRLCEVWLDHFQDPPPEGQPARLPPVGPARTPLVNFIGACMRRVMSGRALPLPDTVRSNINRVMPRRRGS
jgi:hypothetical protein